MKDLYAKVDVLNERWRELEERLRGVPIKVDGVPLSMERHPNGSMRLFYKGKPINECTAEEKIEAASHLQAFFAARAHRRAELINLCDVAINHLETWLSNAEREE